MEFRLMLLLGLGLVAGVARADEEDECLVTLEEGEIEAWEESDDEVAAEHSDAAGVTVMNATLAGGVVDLDSPAGSFPHQFTPYVVDPTPEGLATWLERLESGTATFADFGVPEPTLDGVTALAAAASVAGPTYYIAAGTLGYGSTKADIYSVTCPSSATKLTGAIQDLNTIANTGVGPLLSWGKAGLPMRSCTDTESTSTAGCLPIGSYAAVHGSGTYTVKVSKILVSGTTTNNPEDYIFIVDCRNAANQVVGPISWKLTQNQ